MKLLNKLNDTSMINEVTDKNFVSDAEKTAITHSNRSVLDLLTAPSGQLQYNGTSIGIDLKSVKWGDFVNI